MLESAALPAEEEEEEDAEENHDSQLLIATNIGPVGSVQAPEIDAAKKLERRKLIEALLWLMLLVILWTVNLVLFKKTSSAQLYLP